jgi:uncharacterized SAM-binding protein YcdF (DUF218 family)
MSGCIDSIDIEAVNEIAAFLAMNDFGSLSESEEASAIGCVVLAGNSVLHTAESAFRFARQNPSSKLLISGGIGHSTHRLYHEVGAHPSYRTVPTGGRTEAEILRDIAVRYWNVDPNRVIVESESTNCGENARLSRVSLDAERLEPDRILLIQDPTMQRRTDAAFRRVWQDRPEVRFLNWPTFTPRVRAVRNALAFDLDQIGGLWPMDRFLSLLMGEIPRLRNDARGYGPNGKGFIVAVDVPQEIEEAYRRLAAGLCSPFGERAVSHA